MVPSEGPCPICAKTKKGLGMIAHLEYDHNKSHKEIQALMRDYPHEKRENAVQKFKNGDRVIASGGPGHELRGEVTYAGTDGAVEVMGDGEGGMFSQRMVRLENAEPLCPTCEERRKNGGAGRCAACTQKIIDKNPELKALQEKGKAVLDGLTRGNTKYGGKK